MDGIRNHLREVWWLLMLRGLALLLFGLVAVFWPGLTLIALAAAFAAYLLVTGVINIITSIRAQGRRSLWFLTLLLGLAEIGVAIYLLKSGLVLATFIALIGIVLIVLGILEIIAAFEPGEDPGRRFLLVVGGALALIAGFFVLQYPVSSGLAFVWILGAWGIIAGAIEIAMALSVRARFENGHGGPDRGRDLGPERLRER